MGGVADDAEVTGDERVRPAPQASWGVDQRRLRMPSAVFGRRESVMKAERAALI
jgi:hypothetical protein